MQSGDGHPYEHALAGHYDLQSPPQGACDGPGLRDALRGATAWLSLHAAGVNSLNVFPVPDGDTGTNMVLTMESALKEAQKLPLHGAGEVAKAVSQGALMGARGNSGVILSQIIRGLANGLDGRESFDGAVLAESLQAAAQTAYRAVSKPVEGTILTVIRECAEAALGASRRDPSLRYVLKMTVLEAWDSVKRTPQLLPVLAEAGVVDAGGQGLALVLEGMLLYFSGELENRMGAAEVPFPEDVSFVDVHGPEEFGYCTNFILRGKGLQVEEIRERIAGLGHSAVVAGDETIIKVHVHTEYPGTILNYAVGLGSLTNIEITNMDEQRAELKPRLKMAEVLPALPDLPAHPIMIIAVSPGDGLSEVLESVGAAAIVAGGQTMNPSTEELLQAIESLPCNQVIVLPNNSNVIMAARQAAELSGKEVRVVPTDTVPQGIAAMVAFNYEADLSSNLETMEQAAASVQTAEITWAVRDAVLDGVEVQEGQVIGLLNGVLEAAGEDEPLVTEELLQRMGAADLELITIYYGQDVSEEQATDMADRIAEQYPDHEIELLYGGQPYYRYIISAE
ncbi:MAG: DAK2 domain-containing protein [Chloroflexia bacterium]|nr:DAK2 domain-containing protein [Chloroflexia bacterium]